MMNTLIQAMTDMLTLLGGGLVSIGKSLGTGIVTMVKYLMFEVDATTNAVSGINEFTAVIFILAGVAIALGIFYKIYLLVSSAGGRR